MRVSMVSAQVSPLAAPGAAGRDQSHFVAELSAALTRSGHRVTVYTRRDNPDVDPSVIAPGGYQLVHITAGPPRPLSVEQQVPHLISFGRGLRSHWSRRPPDVVHAHYWMSGLAALLAGPPRGVPTVQTFHRLGSVRRRGRGSPRRLSLERLIARRADLVTAGSTAELTELAQLGVPRSRLAVVPFGVDLSFFTRDGLRAPKYARHRLVTIGPATLELAVVIEAVRRLPDTELVVADRPGGRAVADDPDAQRLRRFAERLGIADRIRLAGPISAEVLPALLRSADALLCLPAGPMPGAVPLQAMACGVPVIGSTTSGLGDIVVDEVTGVLVNRSASAVTEAVHHVLADRATADAYALAARDRVSSQHSWEDIADRVARVYDRAQPEPAAAPVQRPAI